MNKTIAWFKERWDKVIAWFKERWNQVPPGENKHYWVYSGGQQGFRSCSVCECIQYKRNEKDGELYWATQVLGKAYEECSEWRTSKCISVKV